MASLTGGGLEIQSSIPEYSSNTTIGLNKFQVCSLSTVSEDTTRTYNFNGTCLFIISNGNISYNGTSYLRSVFGTSISMRQNSTGDAFKIAAIRIY